METVFDAPELGRIAVFAPRAGLDLSALDKDRLHLIQGFKPDHDAWARAGYDVSVAPQGAYSAAILCLPCAKALARDLIAQARALTSGPILVDGDKVDGIESALRDLRKRAEVGGPVSKAHGKAFQVTGGDFGDWRAAPAQVEGFQTLPGVFSADGIDPASKLLAEALPAKLPKRMADLGAGWGYLSAQTLSREGIEALHLVEADHAALECARANVADARARFHWADARDVDLKALDGVIMNPPFHQARAAEPKLGLAFIASAARILAPHGRLWMVANRHLPYEVSLKDAFRTVTEIAGDTRFKVLYAEKPSRRGR
ncbi:Ribosomal RNA small subunit methyltransferase C [Candidatus Rhodobacter oscarellae]|uniref:Ribosomal RNA small subunit methyltransferase C n=1 Tax=Candidatus Rhodobacter oscarellae TaxID=1675527 RepID=A0A0J9E9X7_9RHOB|nr:Ribosomal RNA small subunit methyltransferase C [Candidatus Rhodobacter lobularis]